MSQKNLINQAASVAARLLQRSRSTGEDYQALLTRYGLERLMYRLSQSTLANRFVVKGALAFLVWADEPFRATRDLDLLAIPEPSRNELLELFGSLCHMEVADDGLSFDEKSALHENLWVYSGGIGRSPSAWNKAILRISGLLKPLAKLDTSPAPLFIASTTPLENRFLALNQLSIRSSCRSSVFTKALMGGRRLRFAPRHQRRRYLDAA